ncbi:MAG: DsbA family protein [Haloferacaceae archaeon]
MERTRRAVLGSVGAGLAGLAGCTGNAAPGDVSAAGDCTIESEPTVSELSPPVAGDPGADVTVVAFEDFACPHCRDYHLNVYPTVASEYLEPGRVRYEHHDFPIPVDERWSWWVASAARGVQDTVGDAAFFEFATLAFERQDDYSLGTLADIAETVGADPCAVQTDAANETYRPVLEADRERGAEMGVSGTPSTFVNGQSVSPTVEGLRTAIERAL